MIIINFKKKDKTVIVSENTINDLSNRIKNVEEKSEIIYRQLFDIQNILSSLNYINNDLDLLNQTTKEKVLIVGFYGADNFGDELMLSTLIENLEKRKNVEISVLIEDYIHYNTAAHLNVKYIHTLHNENDFKKVLAYYDTLIFGGGATIDDTNFGVKFRNYVSLANVFINLSKLFIDSGKKVILYGLSSSNNIVNKEYIQELNYIFSNAYYISLRDTNSYNYLKSLDINMKNVKIDHDIIFANDCIASYCSKNKKSVKEKSNSIGLILICNDDLFKFNLDLLNYLLNSTNFNIDLIPFYNYYNNDVDYLYTYLKELGNTSRINIIPYTNSIEKIIKTFNDEDFIISQRYHATLISTMLNKPTIALCYDKHIHYKFKIDYIKKEYNPNLNIINITDLYDINELQNIIDAADSKKYSFNTKFLNDSKKSIQDIIEKIV